MANFAWGDVDEIVCQHPNLGSFRFFPKANEDYTVDMGGVRTNDDTNQVTSNGQNIKQMNRARWRFEGPVAVESDGSTLDNINRLTAEAEDGTWTFTLLNGTIYKGKGSPVGDVQLSSNAGTMSLIVGGGGVLERI